MSSDDWNRKRKLLLDAIKRKEIEGWKYSGENTNRFYRNLDWNVGRLYMVGGIDQNKIMWLLRARSDLLNLNGNRFQANASKICSLCNVNEIENVQHFLGTCPILSEFRCYYFGKTTLSNEEIVNVLNLKAIELKNIVNYIVYSLKYRSELVNEYNYN